MQASFETTSADQARFSRPDAGQSSQVHVLVVDDNVDAALMMGSLLRLAGHKTVTVHDGQDVLDAARSLVPDVVLLDIGMPGVNGYQAAQLLRRDPLFNDTLLVALTGWCSDADKRAALEAGFDLHLAKPVRPDAVLQILSRLRPRQRMA
jgi:CheY-like chemotaxis protein